MSALNQSDNLAGKLAGKLCWRESCIFGCSCNFAFSRLSATQKRELRQGSNGARVGARSTAPAKSKKSKRPFAFILIKTMRIEARKLAGSFVLKAKISINESYNRKTSIYHLMLCTFAGTGTLQQHFPLSPRSRWRNTELTLTVSRR